MDVREQRKRRNAGCRRSPPCKPLLARRVTVNQTSDVNARLAMQASTGRRFETYAPGEARAPTRSVLWAALMGLFKPKKKPVSDKP